MSFLAVRDGELDTLSLKGSLSVHLNSAVMDEDVDGGATVGGIDQDEAVPLFSVEPFDCASPVQVSLPVNLFSASIGCAYVAGSVSRLARRRARFSTAVSNASSVVPSTWSSASSVFWPLSAQVGPVSGTVPWPSPASEPCGVIRVRTACMEGCVHLSQEQAQFVVGSALELLLEGAAGPREVLQNRGLFQAHRFGDLSGGKSIEVPGHHTALFEGQLEKRVQDVPLLLVQFCHLQGGAPVRARLRQPVSQIAFGLLGDRLPRKGPQGDRAQLRPAGCAQAGLSASVPRRRCARRLRLPGTPLHGAGGTE